MSLVAKSLSSGIKLLSVNGANKWAKDHEDITDTAPSSVTASESVYSGMLKRKKGGGRRRSLGRIMCAVDL